jgi:hypothetical protein
LSGNSGIEIIGYPLLSEDNTSQLRTYRLIERAFEIVWRKVVAGLPLENSVEEEPIILVHTPLEKLDAEQRQRVSTMNQLNERTLEAIRARIESAIGRDKLTIVLAPSKYEYGRDLEEGAVADLVANSVIESVERLKLPKLDGREVIDTNDFWPIDGHWNASGHRKIGNFLEKYISTIIDAKIEGLENH